MGEDFISPLTGDRLTSAEAMLFNDKHTSSTKAEHDPKCYICNDPDFAQMGLPLCRPCDECKRADPPRQGHVAADDDVCTICGTDVHDTIEFIAWQAEQDARFDAEKTAQNG